MATMAAGAAGVAAGTGWGFGGGAAQGMRRQRAWGATERRLGIRAIPRPGVGAFTAVVLAASFAVSIAVWSLANEDPVLRTPWAFSRSETPLMLGGFGKGTTEPVTLDGDVRLTWWAFDAYGCRFRASLVDAAGTEREFADSVVAPTASEAVAIRGVPAGRYALRVRSVCAWTVTFDGLT